MNDNVIFADIGNPYLMSENIILESLIYPQSEYEYQLKYNTNIESLIRDYYRLYLNDPIPQSSQIIYGYGINGVFSSIVYALSKLYDEKLWIEHISPTPSYMGLYDASSTFLNQVRYTLADTDITGYPHMEVAISPNNPDGLFLDKEQLSDETMQHINESSNICVVDECYNKPIFTGEFHTKQPIDDLFTNKNRLIYLSSFSKYGIPSARFGWAIISDPQIAYYAFEYTKKSTLGYTIPSYEAAKLLLYKYLISNSNYTTHIYNTIQKRFTQLEYVFEDQSIPYMTPGRTSPYLYTYLPPSYWMKYSIKTRDSSDLFLSKNKGSRFNLMLDTKSWNKLISRLTSL